MSQQIDFGFCQQCGCYLLPGTEQTLDIDGQALVVCLDCASHLDGCEDLADAFCRKYNIEG